MMGSISAPTIWATMWAPWRLPKWWRGVVQPSARALSIAAVAGVTGGVQASPCLWTALASACQSSGQSAPLPPSSKQGLGCRLLGRKLTIDSLLPNSANQGGRLTFVEHLLRCKALLLLFTHVILIFFLIQILEIFR